jgi:hypothetical protein
MTMFERFTPAPRQVVGRAHDEARGFWHPWLGAEHLLLGILTRPREPGVSALAEIGVTVDEGRTVLSQLVGRGGFPRR